MNLLELKKNKEMMMKLERKINLDENLDKRWEAITHQQEEAKSESKEGFFDWIKLVTSITDP
jgi:hypothetical protein